MWTKIFFNLYKKVEWTNTLGPKIGLGIFMYPHNNPSLLNLQKGKRLYRLQREAASLIGVHSTFFFRESTWSIWLDFPKDSTSSRPLYVSKLHWVLLSLHFLTNRVPPNWLVVERLWVQFPQYRNKNNRFFVNL